MAMNELQVTVNQTLGEIKWNFEELRDGLAAQMDVYKSIVYTDENIASARSDVAALRKLSKAVNARKIDIKNKCLEPYALIESQAKELVRLIDEPIALIDEKVKDYEARQKAEKKAKIMDAMDREFADLPSDIRKKLQIKVYDPKWENASTSARTYMSAIKAAHDETVDALKILENVDEDYRDIVVGTYKVNLNMTEAMLKSQELQKQKEMIAERERRRAEEKARKPEAEKPAPEPAKVPEPPAQAEEPKEEVVYRNVADRNYVHLSICGTNEQIQKVIGYIKYIGAECQIKG